MYNLAIENQPSNNNIIVIGAAAGGGALVVVITVVVVICCKRYSSIYKTWNKMTMQKKLRIYTITVSNIAEDAERIKLFV